MPTILDSAVGKTVKAIALRATGADAEIEITFTDGSALAFLAEQQRPSMQAVFEPAPKAGEYPKPEGKIETIPYGTVARGEGQ